MLAFTVEARIGIRLSAGVSTGDVAPPDVTRQAEFRRFPLRLGAYWPMPLGVGQLEPGLGLDLDLISVSIRDDGIPAGLADLLLRAVCVAAPARDLALGWSVASTHHVYLRALARAGLAAAYDFVTAMNGDPNLAYAKHLPRGRCRIRPLVSLTNPGAAEH